MINANGVSFIYHSAFCIIKFCIYIIFRDVVITRTIRIQDIFDNTLFVFSRGALSRIWPAVQNNDVKYILSILKAKQLALGFSLVAFLVSPPPTRPLRPLPDPYLIPGGYLIHRAPKVHKNTSCFIITIRATKGFGTILFWSDSTLQK